MKTKALKREDRLRQIMLAFAVDLQTGGEARMTLADIARDMHLSPSTKLRDMVTELQIKGLLTSETEPIPGVCQFRRIYSPTGAFDLGRGKPKREPRAVKFSAVKHGQTLLWEEVIS